MCFVIVKGQEKPYIASRDIRCYKVMNRIGGNLTSLFLAFPYKEGVVYRRPFKIKLIKPRRFGDIINVGYHSYRTKKRAKNHCDYLHNEVVVSCIIPKGTLFFKNKFEYVSNGIKIEGIIH